MLQLKLEIMYGLAQMLQCYPVLPLENGQLLQLGSSYERRLPPQW